MAPAYGNLDMGGLGGMLFPKTFFLWQLHFLRKLVHEKLCPPCPLNAGNVESIRKINTYRGGFRGAKVVNFRYN